jgi:hypothetical protein
MKSKINIILFVLTLVFLSGCARLTSIYRTTPIKGDEVIAVDAKQRFAAIKYQTKETVVADRQSETTTTKTIDKFCAEPSPDALSAISASLSGGLTRPSGDSIRAAASLAESSSNIGLRTQSIQLLRDGMYRVCEAYFSGAITASQVKRLLSRYQDTMVAILAIEQLTGVATPRQVVLGGSASAGVGGELNEALGALNLARKNEKEAKAELDALKAATPAKPTEEIEAAEKKHEDAKDALKIQEDAFEAAKARLKTYAYSGGEAYEISTTVSLSDSAAQHISKAVTDIVDNAMLSNEFVASCLEMFEIENNLVREASVAAVSTRKDAPLVLNNINKIRKDVAPRIANCNKLIDAQALRMTQCGRPDCDK